MNRPPPLLPLLLLALLTLRLPDASAQETGGPKGRQAKPAPAQSKPAQARQPMRLVVQQGQHRVSNGFILFSPDGRLLLTSGLDSF